MHQTRHEDYLSSAQIKEQFEGQDFLRYLDLSNDKQYWRVVVLFQQDEQLNKLFDLAYERKNKRESLS